MAPKRVPEGMNSRGGKLHSWLNTSYCWDSIIKSSGWCSWLQKTACFHALTREVLGAQEEQINGLYKVSKFRRTKENLNEGVRKVSSGWRLRQLPRVKSSYNPGCDSEDQILSELILRSWLETKGQASLDTRKERHWAFKNQLNKDILKMEGNNINKESLVLGIECMPGTVKIIFHILSLFILTTIRLYGWRLQSWRNKRKK